MNSSINTWIALRNERIRQLRCLVTALSGADELAVEWAIRHLDGLPEHWVAADERGHETKGYGADHGAEQAVEVARQSGSSAERSAPGAVKAVEPDSPATLEDREYVAGLERRIVDLAKGGETIIAERDRLRAHVFNGEEYMAALAKGDRDPELLSSARIWVACNLGAEPDDVRLAQEKKAFPCPDCGGTGDRPELAAALRKPPAQS